MLILKWNFSNHLQREYQSRRHDMIDWDDLPLIDFNLFPYNAITNLTLHEINDVLNSPREDMITEQQPSSSIPQLSSSMPEDIRQEMDELEEEMKSESSLRQEKQHSERFLKFITFK